MCGEFGGFEVTVRLDSNDKNFDSRTDASVLLIVV